jgi:hypothetical protein
MGNKRQHGNMTPQKVNNHTIEDFLDSEEDKSPLAEVRRIMIRMVNEDKEDEQKNNSMKLMGIQIKNSRIH